MSRRAIFLDRDGVIIRDTGYVARASEVELLPGAAEALRRLADAGWALVVVTNQSGIGRGYFARSDYDAVTAAMVEALAQRGARLDAVYHCPHAPDAHCDCRKPAPGMILAAARDLDIDRAASWLIGDRASDIEAAQAAGIGRALLLASNDAADRAGDTVTSLAQAADAILT